MRKRFDENGLEWVWDTYSNESCWVRVATVRERQQLYNGIGLPERIHLALVFCPHCGDTHQHGWLTGTRTPHCSTPPNPAHFGPEEGREYYLECPDDFPITDLPNHD